MGFDDACSAVIAALRQDTTLAALTILDNPVDQVTDDLTAMVHPFGGTWDGESLDTCAVAGEIRIALCTKERATTAGGFAADMAALRPYADLVPRALIRANAAHRFGHSIVMIGGEGVPWIRMERPTREQMNGLDLLWLRFSLAVTMHEEV